MNDITRYQPVNLANFEKLPQFARVPADIVRDIRVVGSVLPFKSNNYVVERLINWDDIPHDPMFQLTFPQRRMLSEAHYEAVAACLDRGASPEELRGVVNEIRLELNPHPAGQLEHNVPIVDGERMRGMQHKYDETVLFFPSQGQTCHAYCTYCFRWAQFVGMSDLKFASREAHRLAAYLVDNPQVSDVLFTGGDPMVMRSKLIAAYVDALLEANPPNLRTIRFGTKALAYWPQRFTSDADAEALLDVFSRIIASGRQVALMGHFNHVVECSTPEVRAAVKAIRSRGVNIRTQSPVVAHINDDSAMWAEMWRTQTQMGMIPYYMFLARDTGPQDYFKVPLWRAHRIFTTAYRHTSGLCRTVRGPSMSTTPGKIAVDGVATINGEKVFVLHFIQARDPEWVNRPFFAKFTKDACWLDDLEPAFGESEFFFEARLRDLLDQDDLEAERLSAEA